MSGKAHNVDPSAAFIRKQVEFAAHIRDPKKNPRPEEVEERRMVIYRELFYNNVENFIANGFPVLRKLYNDTRWHAMVRDFFANHQCHTPYFLEISQEFLDYLQNERKMQDDDPAFMIELAHYEWVELAVSIEEVEIDLSGVDTNGDLIDQAIVLTPTAWPLAYHYDVHKIGPSYQPTESEQVPTYLVVYRDIQDEVRFMEINAVTARLIELIQSEPSHSGKTHLEQIAKELQHPNPDVVIQGGVQTLEDLRTARVVLGTRTPQ